MLLAIAQPQGRIALLCQALDGAAQLAQRVHEVANRALVHARYAAEFKLCALGAGQQGQSCRERAHGGAGIAQEQGRFAHAELPAQTTDANDVLTRAFDGAAELGQGLQHHPGIVRIQQVHDIGLAFTQGGQQQDTVGDAFGSRQPDGTSGGGEGRDVEMVDGVHARGRGRRAPRGVVGLLQPLGLLVLMRQCARAWLA